MQIGQSDRTFTPDRKVIDGSNPFYSTKLDTSAPLIMECDGKKTDLQ